MITLTPAEDLIEGVAMRLFRVSAHMLRPWPGEAQWHDITEERRMLYRVMAIHAFSLIAPTDTRSARRPVGAGDLAPSQPHPAPTSRPGQRDPPRATRSEQVHADLDAELLDFDMAPTLARLRLAFAPTDTPAARRPVGAGETIEGASTSVRARTHQKDTVT